MFNLCCDENIGSELALMEERFDDLEELLLYISTKRTREDASMKRNPVYFDSVSMDPNWRRSMGAWMFNIAKSFDLTPDTVSLALYIYDTYFSASGLAVTKIEVMKVSLVSMWIASQHDSRPIDHEEVLALVASTPIKQFSAKSLSKTQKQLLMLMDYRFGDPSAFLFARDIIRVLHTISGGLISPKIFEYFNLWVEDKLRTAIVCANALSFRNSSIALSVVVMFWTQLQLDPIVLSSAVSKLSDVNVELDKACCQWINGNTLVDGYDWIDSDEFDKLAGVKAWESIEDIDLTTPLYTSPLTVDAFDNATEAVHTPASLPAPQASPLSRKRKRRSKQQEEDKPVKRSTPTPSVPIQPAAPLAQKHKEPVKKPTA